MNLNVERYRFHPLKIADIVEETPQAKSFAFSLPEDLEEVFAYKPGQYLSVKTSIGDSSEVRAYSISSAKELGEQIKVTVKRVEGGKVSNHLNDNFAPGDTLEVLPPMGSFVCEGDKDVLIFSAGSGITPCIAILKWLLATSDRRVHMVYSNRSYEEMIFAKELSQLESRFNERVSIDYRIDSIHGFLTRETAAEISLQFQDRDVFICGPGPFMEAAAEGAAQSGIAKDSIHMESFQASIQESEDDASIEKIDSSIALSLEGKSYNIQCKAGETILAAAQRAGIQLPSSCEAGNCGCCVARVCDGSVEMKHNEALSEDEIEFGLTLTCQTLATSETCSIEFL